MVETVCVECGQSIADRSTYIPTEDGPKHPFCWERGYLARPSKKLRSLRYERDLASGHKTYTRPWW